MTWYDHNKHEDRVEVGGQMAAMIGFSWIIFAIGTWLAVWFFWDLSSAPGHVRDGSDIDREGYAFTAALFGIIPSFIIVLLRASRDIHKQTEAAKQIQAQHAAQEAAVLNIQKTAHLAPQRKAGFSGLTLGMSTGFLSSRGHYAGIEHGKTLHLSRADVCKNIWIAGGIGSGKTTRFINPLLQQVLSQDCSVLVFDINENFRRELDYISQRVRRSYKVVGEGGLTLNLFRGCTPEVAASYLKSCFIASGTANGDDTVWADTATNYCRNLLTLIKLAKGDYSIAGLADLVFSEAKRDQALRAARERERAGEMEARDARTWAAVSSYMMNTVASWDHQVRANVLSMCDAVLNPFISSDLVDAFSVESPNGEANLYDLLNKPEIFLVNLPRHKFGVQGARFAYLLIKLRFFTMMNERRARADVNQERYVCFLCDEYHSIVDSVSDTDFWGKSRSSKCFGVVSMPGYSSLVHAVGNPKAASSIMQNWRQRAIFRTEDVATIEMVQNLLGQVDVHVTSESYNTTTSRGRSTSNGYEFRYITSTSTSEGASTDIQRQHLFDANDFRKLDAQYALFAGTVGDKAADDVIEAQPIFVSEND